MIGNLRDYVSNQTKLFKPKEGYENEFFWSIAADYYGSKGEFTDDDIVFLNENGFVESDFTDFE